MTAPVRRPQGGGAGSAPSKSATVHNTNKQTSRNTDQQWHIPGASNVPCHLAHGSLGPHESACPQAVS